MKGLVFTFLLSTEYVFPEKFLACLLVLDNTTFY